MRQRSAVSVAAVWLVNNRRELVVTTWAAMKGRTSNGRERTARRGLFGALLVGMTFLATGCPTPPTTVETLEIGASPVSTRYCYKKWNLQILRLSVESANVPFEGGPVVHASLSSGEEFDLTSPNPDGMPTNYLEPPAETLHANGCIDITWTALRSPAGGPLVILVRNTGYY